MKTQTSKPNDLDTFQWQGVNNHGKRLDGEITGSSVALVKAQLRKQGITPSKVKRKPKPLFGMSGSQKITSQDIATITRQIATMLTAGVSLVQTLEMLTQVPKINLYQSYLAGFVTK